MTRYASYTHVDGTQLPKLVLRRNPFAADCSLCRWMLFTSASWGTPWRPCRHTDAHSHTHAVSSDGTFKSSMCHIAPMNNRTVLIKFGEVVKVLKIVAAFGKLLYLQRHHRLRRWGNQILSTKSVYASARETENACNKEAKCTYFFPTREMFALCVCVCVRA